MGRRLRLADGAGSKSLPKSGPACPSPSTKPRPQSQACRRSVGCSTGETAEKRHLSPTIIAFQNSGHCRRAWHTNPVGEPFAPRPNRRPRRAGVAALGAPIAPGAAQNDKRNVSRLSAPRPFEPIPLRAKRSGGLLALFGLPPLFAIRSVFRRRPGKSGVEMRHVRP